MEKNTAWAIGLSSIVLIGFFFLQTFLAPKQSAQTPAAANSTEQVSSEQSSSTPVTDSTPEKAIAASAKDSAAEDTFVIETNKLRVTFTNRGGDVIGYELKDHKDTDTGDYIEMADNITKTNRAFALALGGANEAIIDDIFNARKINDNTIGFFKNYSVKMH